MFQGMCCFMKIFFLLFYLLILETWTIILVTLFLFLCLIALLSCLLVGLVPNLSTVSCNISPSSPPMHTDLDNPIESPYSSHHKESPGPVLGSDLRFSLPDDTFLSDTSHYSNSNTHTSSIPINNDPSIPHLPTLEVALGRPSRLHRLPSYLKIMSVLWSYHLN